MSVNQFIPTTEALLEEMKSTYMAQLSPYTRYIKALLFATAMHEPIEITIGVTGSQGINSIDYKAFLGKSPVPQRLEVDVVVMSISTGATDGSASIFGGSMAVIHIDQSQASSHPENGAVAAMVGPDIKPWFGNIVVVACNAEGTVFVDMTSATVARDCVMCVMREKLEPAF